MPPSAGACQTTAAALKPDCGRASNWSSIMTAIGCWAATFGDTSTPVSGAGTSTGVGSGAGGVALGSGAVEGWTAVPVGAGCVPGAGVPVAAAAPPGKSVPICAATTIANPAIDTAMSPMR